MLLSTWLKALAIPLTVILLLLVVPWVVLVLVGAEIIGIVV
jgi:hypothetical protein